MEKTKNNLKTTSIVVLALAGLSLIRIIFEIFFGSFKDALNDATIPEGSPENIILIAQIFVLVVSFLVTLPQFYIGIKGLKMAKNPDSSKGHIIWGVIVLILNAIGLISPFVAIIKGNGDVFSNVAALLSIGVDVFILFEYVKYANTLRKEI